jgi:biotin synthase-like enzyme
MKKKLLMLRTASSFLSKEWAHINYLPAGTCVVASGIDTEKYDVDFFDYDSYLRKRYISGVKYFSGYSTELTYNDRMKRLFEPFRDVDKYDYILMSAYYYGSVAEPMFEFNNVLVDYLRERNPTAVIVGGGKVTYFTSKKSEKSYNKFVSKLDVFCKDRIIPQNVSKIMETLSLNSIKWDIRELNSLCPEPFNCEDVKHTYEEIFRDAECELPEEAPKNKTIKMCEMVFNDGCVGNCAFCSVGNIQFKSLSFDKIETILKTRVFEQGYDTFYFLNNAVNPSIKYLEKFCNLIIKNNMNIRWSDSARFHGMGPDEFKMIFEAGGRIISYGCETVDNNMLEFINKKITVDDIIQGLRWSHEAGLWNVANFIVGFPHEDADVVVKLIKFLRKNIDIIDTAYINNFRMLYDSPFYLESEKYGISIPEGYLVDNASLLGSMYDEIDGLSWSIIKRASRFKKELVERELSKFGKPTQFYSTSQHFIFALYDIFNDNKEIVREYRRWHLN